METIFDQEILGTRQHFIKFELPETWYIHNKAELLYDATLGFRDKIGFRLGFAFPFFTPNANLEPSQLIELPLIIMDAAIWTWLKLTEASALQTILKIRDIIKQSHGLLTILWHQCVLKMKGGRIYEDLIKNLVNESVYTATGAEIAKWWSDRNDFQVNITLNNNEISVLLHNPRKIKNLGIVIRTKKKNEIISTSSNLNVVEKSDSILKITFIEGASGKLLLKSM